MRKILGTNLSRIIIICIFSVFCTQINAALVSFDYTGTILRSSGQIIVPEGTTFSGSFSYQDDVNGLPRLDATLYSPVNFSLSIDSADISFSGSMLVDDNSTQIFNGFDVVQIGLFGIGPIPSINNVEIQGISINLTDSTQTNLTDESLPLSFDLSAWPAFNRTLAIYSFTNGTGSPTIGLIESITPGAPVSSVPVPAAIWLFGTALLGFLGFSQRRKHD